MSLSDGKHCSRVPHWVCDSIEWLGDLFGKLTPVGMTVPACTGKINGDHESVLSVSCTIGHLKKQDSTVAHMLIDALVLIEKAYPFVILENSLMSELIKGMKLKDVMETLGMGEDAITQIDIALKQFANQI